MVPSGREARMSATGNAAASKRLLRAAVQRALANVSRHMLASVGQSVSRRLLALPVVRQASVLAAYAAMPEELSIDEVVTAKLHEGGTVVLPRYCAATRHYEMVVVRSVDEDLVPGHYGVREPRPELPPVEPVCLRSADTVWLVPGLAFDLRGNRLGRGGGYYDRLLAHTAGPRIGVISDWQILPRVPADTHDAAMTMVVSEQRVLHFPPVPEAPQSRKETPCPCISSNRFPSPQ
jgi:5-formyltetrahydrofolate cyclo-ligase